MQRNAVDCDGMRWNAMECDGMRWNAMEYVPPLRRTRGARPVGARDDRYHTSSLAQRPPDAKGVGSHGTLWRARTLAQAPLMSPLMRGPRSERVGGGGATRRDAANARLRASCNRRATSARGRRNDFGREGARPSQADHGLNAAAAPRTSHSNRRRASSRTCREDVAHQKSRPSPLAVTDTVTDDAAMARARGPFPARARRRAAGAQAPTPIPAPTHPREAVEPRASSSSEPKRPRAARSPHPAQRATHHTQAHRQFRTRAVSRPRARAPRRHTTHNHKERTTKEAYGTRPEDESDVRVRSNAPRHAP